MGDTWPYGPPLYETWDHVYQWFVNEGYSTNTAAVFAAIGTAESGLDERVVNDTPATGDLSVGIFQINYFDGLYAGRAAEFGTPEELVQGGLSRQAYAALQLYLARGGWGDWSTYNNGAYQQYLHGYTPGGFGQIGAVAAYVVALPLFNESDWSYKVTGAANYNFLAGHSASNTAAALNSLR